MLWNRLAGWMLLLVWTLGLPGSIACAADEEPSHADTPESRVEASSQNAQQIILGEAIQLEHGRTLTINDYTTQACFRYSPAGGFSTLTLSAKPGYVLLTLCVTVQNNNAESLYTATLLDTEVRYGSEYEKKAQDSFFYQTASKTYAGGLKEVKPNSTVDGLFLFAVPEKVESTDENLTVQMQYGDTLFECALREPAA